MLRLRAILFTVFLIAGSIAHAQSWVFRSGEYTHDPDTGKRVNQYEELPTVERIPFQEYFSEDGPKPYGMGTWYDFSWYRGGWFDFGGYDWSGIQRVLPTTYPIYVP
jgi:hypothetical protein